MLKFLRRKIKSPDYWKTVEGTNWLNFLTGSVVGFSDKKPQIGDILFSEMRSGNVGVFRFVEVRPCNDPSDMFFGVVETLGYYNETNYNKDQKVHSMGYVL